MPIPVSSAASNTKGAVVTIGYFPITSSTGSMTFSNVPQIYQDLRIVVNGVTSSASRFYVSYGDSSTLYSDTWMITDMSATTYQSGRYINQNSNNVGGLINGSGTTYPSVHETYIPNYTNTVTYKSALSRFSKDLNGSASPNYAAWEQVASLWRSTAAISTVTVGFGGLMTFGSVSLYGIRTVGQ
jgi:hypothetical protein